MGRFRPRLIETLRTYRRDDFLHDLIAGITMGLVALPLAMAFGIASGVTPQASIYTAIVGGFLVSALGGSKIQIGGPTGAFVVVVAAIIAAPHQPRKFLKRAEFVDHIGHENILPDINAALKRAEKIYRQPVA